MKKTGLLVMWICLWFASEAQNSFIRYGINEGLSQLQVMQLTQDNNGYIWACTKGGISQFDGIRFTNYIIGKELLETPKTRLVFDSLGNAWFTTKHTICFFDRKNRKFHHTFMPNRIWSDDIELEVLDEKIRCAITKENVASVWLFYPKTLTLSFVRQEKLTPYRFADNIFRTYVDCDDPSKLANDGSSLRFFARELRTVMSNDTLVYYLAHKNFAKNTYLIRQKAGKTELVGKYPGNVAIYEMNTKNKFVYYSDGKLYQHRIGQQQHCLGNVELVNDILFDTEDNLWLATEYGLQKYAPFKTFTKLDNLPDMIWATVEDKNHRVWILSYISSHLYYIDESDSFPTRIKRYQHKFKKEGFFFGSRRFQDGTTFFPSHLSYFYDGASFRNVPEMESTVYASYEDTVQHIRYFGGINCLFTQKGKTFTKDSRFTYKQNGLGMMLCFAQTKNLDVWFVTGRSWGWFNNKDTVVNSIKGTPMLGVSSVYADYKDNLWFGCSNGLFFYDHKHFTKVQHPELEYMVNAFHETQSGELLVGGRNGVSFLDLKSFYADGNLRIRFYGKEQGFTGEECGQNNILRDSQQRIWIATGTNLIMFKESDLQDNTNPPRLDMQQITTETDDGKFTVLGYGESVFTHHLENITFEFTGINLRDPSHVMYSCILENYDKQWSEFGFQNLAEYKKLRPGKYRFRVKTRNGYGLESKNELMYSFEIVPAFYQTIWFLVVVVLGLVFAIALIVTLISRSKRKRLVDAIRKEVAQKETESNLILERKNVEMKMVQLERKHDNNMQKVQTETLEGIAHKLHSEVSSDMVAFAKRLRKMEQTVKIREAIDEFERLQLNLQNMSRELTNPLFYDIELKVYLLTVFDKYKASGFAVRMYYEKPENNNWNDLSVDFLRAIYRLSIELVANSFKYSGTDELSLEFNWEEGVLEVNLRDSGIGYDPESIQKNRGYLSYIETSSKWKGSFQDKSRVGLGARLFFKFHTANYMREPKTEG